MKACIAILALAVVAHAAPAENWKQKLFNESTTRLTNFVTLQINALKGAAVGHANTVECTDLATTLFELSKMEAETLFKSVCMKLVHGESKVKKCFDDNESKIVAQIAGDSYKALTCINNSQAN